MRKESVVFFTLFFLAIGLSIFVTYNVIVMRNDFTMFTDSETVPEPSDIFGAILHLFEQ